MEMMLTRPGNVWHMRMRMSECCLIHKTRRSAVQMMRRYSILCDGLWPGLWSRPLMLLLLLVLLIVIIIVPW